MKDLPNACAYLNDGYAYCFLKKVQVPQLEMTCLQQN